MKTEKTMYKFLLFAIVAAITAVNAAEPRLVLKLDAKRNIVKGSRQALADAIDKGADLRISVAFRHNEHLDPSSTNPEIVEEMSDYRVVYRVGKDWTSGIMNLRMPVNGPLGFGSRPSWSFFMYHCDGIQGIARAYLDDKSNNAPRSGKDNENITIHYMPKYHILETYDSSSNAMCQNFVYDFEYFNYYVLDNWEEVYSHDANGKMLTGSFDALIAAIREGKEIKAAVKNFRTPAGSPDNELFTHLGSSYYSTESKLLCINSQPVVTIRPELPLRYRSGNWESGQLVLFTSGKVDYWYFDPYTMIYHKTTENCPIRYFVRKK